MSAAVHSSRFCKGKHSVDGGCGNDNCRGKELCVAGCATCPDFVAEYDGDTNQHCRGEHPVTGGCANEACRGLKLCQPDCTNCPDFQNYLTAKKRGPIAGSFWERPGSAMRLYMACLAGPADPETRNDIHLMQKLQARFQVPQDNYWLLLEKQVSLRSVHATVADVAASMEADDAAFIYLGGHGSAGTETEMYRLGSYYGSAEGETLAPFLWDCPGRIFLVVDSCHAGAMIGDLARFASEHPRKLRCPELTVLTSVQSHLTACTGWKLIGMLIQRLVDAPSLPSEPIDIAKWAASTLRTASAKQRAQYAYFKGGQLVEASDQRVEGS